MTAIPNNSKLSDIEKNIIALSLIALANLLTIAFLAIVLVFPKELYYFDREITTLCLYFHSFSFILVSAALAYALKKKEKVNEDPNLNLFSISHGATVFIFIAFCLGLYTSPASLILISALLVGFLLYDIRTLNKTIMCSIVTLISLEIMVYIDLIPYAPLLAQAPYENGEMIKSWYYHNLVVLLITSICLVYIFQNLFYRIRKREMQLAYFAKTDPLTQIPNRRHFMERLEQESSRCTRYNRPLNILMIDADNFKAINDLHGHKKGDEVLVAIAEVLRTRTRKGTDLSARFGGEEFILMLPEISVSDTEIVANKILKEVRALNFASEHGNFKVSVSIGGASSNDKTVDANALIEKADMNLYKAKGSGRDQYFFSDPKLEF